MDARHAVIDQFLHLVDGELNANLELPGLVVFLGQAAQEDLWQLGSTQRRDAPNLAEVGHGEQTGNDGDVDPQLGTAIPKGKEIAVVVEQLRDDRVRPAVDFATQVLKIDFDARGLLMLLGISGHGDAKRGKLARIRLTKSLA